MQSTNQSSEGSHDSIEAVSLFVTYLNGVGHVSSHRHPSTDCCPDHKEDRSSTHKILRPCYQPSGHRYRSSILQVRLRVPRHDHLPAWPKHGHSRGGIVLADSTNTYNVIHCDQFAVL